MSWNPLYKLEISDVFEHEWTAFIEEESYTGALAALQGDGDPLNIEFMADADNPFSAPVRGTKCDLGVMVATQFQYIGLFSEEDLHYRMSVFNGASLVSAWINDGGNPFETFVSSGSNISSAINTAGGNAFANGDTFTVANGEKILIICKHTLNSGGYSRIVLRNSGWTLYAIHTLTAGWNIFELTTTWAGDATIMIVQPHPDLATNFSLTDFFAFHESQLYYRGWLLSNNYEEEYSDTPYPLTISASDGLGYLKDVTFDDLGEAYSGRMSESEILMIIFGKLGITEFSEIVNVYEDRMNADPEDSPIDQTFIDVVIFEEMTCYEVLEHLLTKWNALLRQWRGKYYIYRPLEMNATAYVRTFTSAIVKTDSTLSAVMEINRATSASEIRDVNGGIMRMIPAMKTLKITQDYGYKESWLVNWQLKGETIAAGEVEGWNKSLFDPGLLPVGNFIPGEKDGVMISIPNLYPSLDHYLYQDFGPYALVSTDDFGIDFEVILFNDTGVAVVNCDLYVQVRNVAGTKFLNEVNDEYCEWTTDNTDLIHLDITAPAGSSDWVSYKRRIAGIPTDDMYRITFYAADFADGVTVGVRYVKFYTTSTQIITTPTKNRIIEYIKRNYTDTTIRFGRKMINILPANRQFENILIREYIITNALNGVIFEDDRILGDVTDSGVDNVVEQFAGALALTNGTQSLAEAATGFIADNAPAWSPDVALSQSSDIIIFTSNTPGIDFTGGSSITPVTPVTGDLDGAVSTTQANSAGTPQVTEVDFTGSTSGSCDFDIDGVVRTMYFTSTLADTLDAFISAEQIYYPNQSFGLSGDKIIVTENASYGGFTVTTTNISGNLDGTENTTQAGSAGTARIDQIDLSGSSGSATITVNGVTRTITIYEKATTFTESWSTRGGTEAVPIIELTGAEIGVQNKRPKQMLSIPVYDGSIATPEPAIIPIGTITDDLNEDSGSNPRVFSFNSGNFNVKNRKWNIDFVEIIKD